MWRSDRSRVLTWTNIDQSDSRDGTSLGQIEPVNTGEGAALTFRAVTFDVSLYDGQNSLASESTGGVLRIPK